ncbi:conserved hypothetical protein (plasmid) [Acaryochloris marina MBIC11017]|uniref:Uncharacterized protein n=2 Tax=Acaryochloris marina TaxID=155978 RepID=A8ZP29_ACAM1|nr:conserved hypothetical protein [Acaryochloris marina MBIC11017]
MAMDSPRIYCIPASEAPVIAVFRRGPSKWFHVGRWDLTQQTYEPGAWLHGRIYPRRSDLSPDGRFLCYFAHKPNATWEHGETYIAISKLPWLRAIYAFGTCGTWTRGYYFIPPDQSDEHLKIDVPFPYNLSSIPVVQFANERHRGWTETADSPLRQPNDLWDEHRNARLYKIQPEGHRILYLESLGLAGGEFGEDQAVDGMSVLYSMQSNEGIEILDAYQWADWDLQGNLLVATRSGKLQVNQVEDNGLRVVFEVDLSVMDPDPLPPPSWAQN